jgi:hypothetical protein
MNAASGYAHGGKGDLCHGRDTRRTWVDTCVHRREIRPGPATIRETDEGADGEENEYWRNGQMGVTHPLEGRRVYQREPPAPTSQLMRGGTCHPAWIR